MNPFDGTWTYRSYLNLPAPFGDLDEPKNLEAFMGSLFAEATLVLAVADLANVTGRLEFGGGVGLDLIGAASYGSPYTIRFQGVGHQDYATGWIYDYCGYLIPMWPNGVSQVPAIAGSVIRTVDHSEGKAKAGKVASFIAVRA
jgi:hypothetical protein